MYKKSSLCLIFYFYSNFATQPIQQVTLHITNSPNNGCPNQNWQAKTYNPDNVYSRHASYIEKCEREEREVYQKIGALKSLENELEREHRVPAFNDSCNGIGNDIRRAEFLLKNAKPGKASLHEMAKTCVALARFKTTSSMVRAELDAVLTKIAPMIMNNAGHFRTSLRRRDNFFWLYDSYDNTVNDFTNKMDAWFAVDGKIECARQTLYNYDPYRKAVDDLAITAKPDFARGDVIAAVTLDKLCHAGNWEGAYSIAASYDQRFKDNILDHFFKQKYFDNFNQKFTYQGISKEYLSHPYYDQCAKFPCVVLPSPFNATLKEQLIARNGILSECGIQQPSAHVEGVIRKIAIDYYARGPQAVMEYLSATVSSDHSDPGMREVGNALCRTNGLPKFYRFNEIVTNAHISSEITTAVHAQDRTLLGQLGLLDLKSEETKSDIQKVVNYINRACSGDEAARAYGTVAQKVGRAVLDGLVGDAPLLALPDFSLSLENQQHEAIKDQVVICIADKLTEIDFNQCKKADAYALIEKVGIAYQKMIAGDAIEQAYLEGGLLPCRSELALEMDTAAFDVPGKGNVQSTIQQIKEYMGICRDMQMYGERDTQREHFADRMVWEYLQSKGQDPAFYQTFTGNQMQHLLWDWNLQALQKGCELYPETLPMSLQNVIEFGLEANLAVKNSIVAKDYMQATGIVTTLNSLFTHIDTVLKLGDDTLKGISDGIVQAVENTCHTIEHIDELPGNFLDVSTKAFKLLVLIEKTNDKLIAGVDREEAFKEFNQKVTPVVNAMVDIAQQASWKDFVRETTAFCVGCKIDSKIFHLVGEAATFAARTESLTKNVFEALAELTAPEAVAVTAERITVNAGKAAEQCALSETKEVAKQGAKVSEALAESAESKIPLSPKITLENEALLKNFNPSHYDPAIICPKLLASAKELFVNIPGAMGDNGPLRQILKRGKIGLNADSSLKGAVYELEKALELESKGEKVIEFGKKIGGREFDIITKTKALECKNISWERFQVGESLVTEKQIKDLINKTQSTFSQQKQFAEEFGLKFEIHSKNKIPENWKIWFSEKNINFFEG